MTIYLYPTDTLWGIGCGIYDENAFEEITKIKKSSKGKPTSILFSCLDQLLVFFDLPEKINKEWLNTFFSYEATLLIPLSYLKKSVPKWIVADSSMVGVRLVHNTATVECCRNSNSPITTTSVNIAGDVPLNILGDIKNFQKHNVPHAILLGDDIIPSGKASSLFKLGDNPSFLRKGRFYKEIEQHAGLLST